MHMLCTVQKCILIYTLAKLLGLNGALLDPITCFRSYTAADHSVQDGTAGISFSSGVSSLTLQRRLLQRAPSSKEAKHGKKQAQQILQ